MSFGWVDKIYWRSTDVFCPAPGEEVLTPRRGGWHAFKRSARRAGEPTAWVSLCDEDLVLAKSGGQGGMRPPLVLRCVVCELREAKRRGGAERPEHLTLHEAERTPVIEFSRERA